MSTQIANVDILTQNWEMIVIRYNRIAELFSSEVVTANGTYANTGNSTVSVTSQIYGTQGANTVVVTTALRGGNVNGLVADLPISTNTHISNGILKIGNTTVNSVANSTSLYISNSTANTTYSINMITPSSNLTIDSTLIVNGDLIVESNSEIKGTQASLANSFYTLVTSNSNIGSNVSVPQVISSFPKASYNSGKILVQIINNGNTQISEMILTHDGTTAEVAVYGTVASPAGANAYSNPLGELSANVNGANVDILLVQTIANSQVKVISNLIN